MTRSRGKPRGRGRSDTPRARRGFLLLASIVAVGLAVGLWLRGRLGRPAALGASLLLVTIDTLRADRIGAYGSGEARTPHLDALAARGLLFEEALASVPLTLPSHATILSGLEPPRHRVRDNGTHVFPEDRETLATLLKARGYATGGFVGAYVLDRRFGLARGFDHYDDRIDRRPEDASVLESERRGEAVVEAASAWIAQREGPFFGWVHFYDPHAPYDPPSPYREQHAGRPYDGEVAYADACLGRLLRAAEARARGRLVVAVLGDHGEGLGDHGERTHGFFIYQPTLRIPLVLAGPGVPEGKRHAGPARTADVLPTLLARLGVATPAALDGVDLLGGPARGEAYAETVYPQTLGWAPLYSFRRGALKYIEAPRPELYDLTADPAESRNLTAERPSEAERLKTALASFRGDDRPGPTSPADPEVAERLRSLGYVAGAPAAAAVASLKDPKDALPLWHLFEEASEAEARGDREGALVRLRQLVAREPASAGLRRNLAAALRRAGRTREAVAVLEALSEIAPGDALAWHEHSVALAELGRIDEALACERRAIALNALLPEPRNHLGILEARRGRPAEALAAFEKATALDPNNARAWNNRANALRTLGRRTEAEHAYRRAAGLAPRDPDPLNGLGVLAVEAGDLDSAARLLVEALTLEPTYDEARLNLAVVEVKRGRTEEARSLLGELLRGRPDRDLARRAQGLLRGLQERR